MRPPSSPSHSGVAVVGALITLAALLLASELVVLGRHVWSPVEAGALDAGRHDYLPVVFGRLRELRTRAAGAGSHSQSAGSSTSVAPHAAVSGHAYFCLLNNDAAIMIKVKEMFADAGYKQLHPWHRHVGKWDVMWAWEDPFYEGATVSATWLR